MTLERKVDCYKCEYRKDIPGGSHSRCYHPSLEQAQATPLAEMASMMGKRMQLTGTQTPFYIKLSPHGIAHGWANHPFNFDPIWVLECQGFKEKAPVEP